MCDKEVLEIGGTLELLLIATNINKCVIKLLIITLIHSNFSPIAI